MFLQLKDEYARQLRSGCMQTVCSKVFCRSSLGDGSIDIVSGILSRYGDAFLCEHIHKALDQETCRQEQRNSLIDLFLHLNTKISCSGRLELEKSVQLDAEEPITPYISEKKSCSTRTRSISEARRWANKKKRRSYTVSERSGVEDQVENMKIDAVSEHGDTQDFDHRMCSLMSVKSFSDEDMYILAGMIQLLLRRYESLPHFTLGMVIVRIYGLVSGCCSLETSSYSILHKIFCNIHSLYGEVLKKAPLSESAACEGIKTHSCLSMCLYPSKFTRADLVVLVESISHTLNASHTTDSRENKKIDSLLNIFHLLYLINEGCGLLNYRKFYLSSFCAKMNFREEFRHLRTKAKTPLNFPFILPVHIKAELIKYENNDKMKTSLQDSFFKSLFEGHVDPYLFITVNRETIYRDSIGIFKGLDAEDARKQLRITFKDEEGIDSGGIRKEYFQLLSQEIKGDEEFFENSENRVWIRPGESNEDTYEAVGKIIAIALYNNVVLNIPFPGLFFKKLLGRASSAEDLKEISQEMATSLRNLRRLSGDEINALGLNFVIEYTVGAVVRSHALVKNGENVRLTTENLWLFIDRFADFYINVLVRPQFDAIKRGFYSIIDKSTMLYLDPKELEKIMMGSNTFDVKAIRSTATYSGFKEDSPVVLHFWNVFESFDRKKKKKLLRFITGNDRIPVSGSASLKLVIMKNGCDTDRLPSSQTCFNTLLLPEYSSREKLEKKLHTALELTAGFFLL